MRASFNPYPFQATVKALFSPGNLEWLYWFAARDNYCNNRADGAGGHTKKKALATFKLGKPGVVADLKKLEVAGFTTDG